MATTFQLQSHNFRNHYIRHRDFLGELTTLRTEQDKQDSLFTIVASSRGQNQLVLRSVNNPKLYLRHQDFRIKLQEPAGPNDHVFWEAATFIQEPGLVDSTGVSFRWVNPPDRYIRHRDFHLFVEPVDSPQSQADATFHKTLPSVRIDPDFVDPD
jgi:hypothetical protein